MKRKLLLVGSLVLAFWPFGQAGAIDHVGNERQDTLAPFPRTIEEVPSDFVFLAVEGPEDRSSYADGLSVESSVDFTRSSLVARPTLVTSSVITAGSCQYRQRTDNIHKTTNTDGTPAVSVHGWWTKELNSGTCPSKANVDIRLLAYGCGSATGCGWVQVGFGTKDVFAGGGSANRANARRTCASSQVVVYKEQVDVDLLDWSDPSGYSEGPDTQVACYPT